MYQPYYFGYVVETNTIRLILRGEEIIKDKLGKSVIQMIIATVTCLALLLINKEPYKELIVILPLIYGVLFISIAKIHKYLYSPGMFLINLICLIRYFLLPIIIIIDNNYLDRYSMFYEGSKLMIYEAIIIGIFLIFVINKYYKNKNTKRVTNLDNNYFILKIIVVFTIIIILINPNVLKQYNFIFTSSSDLELIKGRSLIQGLPSMIIEWGKLSLPLLISIILIKKYRISKNEIYFYLTVLVILFFNLMIFSGTSRNSAIMPATGSMFFLISMFPKKRKKIFIVISMSIFIAVIRLTTLKTNYVGSSNLNTINGIVKYLNAYFLGPENYGIALISKDVFKGVFSLNTFINDILGNFPGLSDLFNLENRTNTLYNLIYHNGGASRDAIIPSIGQGLFYIGYIFSVIPQMIVITCAAIIDKLYRKSNNVGTVYFTAYFAVRFGFTYIQNISIILSFIYSMIIPMSLLLFIDNRVKIKKNKLYKKI